MHLKSTYCRRLAAVLLSTFLITSAAFGLRDDGPPAHNFGGTRSLRQSNGFVVTMKLK